MAPHCSIPAWEIPWTEEPGRLQSIGSQRALCTPLPVLKGVLCPFVPFCTLAVWLLSAIRDSKAT